MTSYFVQYLADASPDGPPLRSFFTHDFPLEEAEKLAIERCAAVPGAVAFRIMDMGGWVQAVKTVPPTQLPT